jgi:two-component system sensor histidine kinase YesM
MKLRLKLFYAFLLFIIIPLVLLGTVTYAISTKIIEVKHGQQTELTLQAISQSVEFKIAEIDKLTESWIGNYYLQNLIASPFSEPIEDPLKLLADEQNFRRILVTHPSIRHALLYQFNGKITQLQKRDDFDPMSFERFRELDIYKDVMDKDGLPVWMAPYEYPHLTGTDSVFTQIRVVNDLNTLEDKAILMVQIKNSEFQKLFQHFRSTTSGEHLQFLLINRSGKISFDHLNQFEGSNLFDLLGRQVEASTAYQSFRTDFQGEKSIVSIYPLAGQEWNIVSITSWSSVTKEMMQIVKWVAGIGLFSLISALMFNLFFVNRIAKSIIRIVRVMRKVEDGDLGIRVPESGNDETLLLARGFNSLVKRISTLINTVRKEQERKTRAELMLLQAQIKPHFLFNTLESINALAIQNEGKKVSQMVYRLGNILRISIQSKEEITISEEIDHLRSYLEIQQFRFGDVFDYEISVPESIWQCNILKLTLQPLVENSIQHGFEGLDRVGHLRVYAEEDEHRVYFYVEDNGIGMSPEILSKFEYKTLDEDHYTKDQLNTERRGLGVSNVADRIRIHFGPLYGLYLCSIPGRGTTIKCVIPKVRPGENL